jgi:hypothetical protein
VQGSVYLIDLDQYAVHQTAQLGVTVKHVSRIKTHADQIFSSDRSEAYKAELIGHEKPITSLAVLREDNSEWLISGDEAGEIRVWDLESRGCVRVIRPWAHSTTATATSDTPKTAAASSTPKTAASSSMKQALHPVTSILIVPQDEDADKKDSSFASLGAGTKESKQKTDIINLISPLQRFTDRQDDGADEKSAWTPVPFLPPKRGRVAAMNRDRASAYAALQHQSSKRPRIAKAFDNGGSLETDGGTNVGDQPGEQNDEVMRLQKELEEARSTIQRWEQVNNKLMTKLKQSQP